MITAPDPLDEPAGRPRITPFRILVAIVVLGSFAIWGYAFFADHEVADRLTNPEFAARAEPVCAAAMTELEALPNALDAIDHVDRANQVVAASDVLARMADDLDAILVQPDLVLDDRDREISTEWVGDWRLYLADRYDYAERLAVEPEAVFFVRASSEGERLERRITRFTITNEMVSCATPGDVG